jgi:hypothetical protein
MARYFCAFGLCAGSAQLSFLKAQDLGPMQLDRPDQTECPFITPVNYVQLENGFTLERINTESRTYSFPGSLMKFGLNETTELRVVAEFAVVDSAGDGTSGFMPLVLGFKTAMFEEKGLFPLTSFIFHLGARTLASREFRLSTMAPAFRFTMQHGISDKVSLSYNLGAEWDGESAKPLYIYTLVAGFALDNRWGIYAESYGFVPGKGDADHRVDSGFTYLVNNDFILDFSAGMGLSEQSPEYYLSLGFSFRFDTAAKQRKNPGSPSR